MTALFAWLQPIPSPSPPVTWFQTSDEPIRTRVPVSTIPSAIVWGFFADDITVCASCESMPSFFSKSNDAPPSPETKMPPSVPNTMAGLPFSWIFEAVWKSSCT